MAEARESVVVYQRDQDGADSDIWDDSALIKAYDNAVSLAKAQLAEKDGSSDANPVQSDSSKKNRNKKMKSKKRRMWQPGDRCQAVFGEDQLLYDAEIESVDYENGMCIVSYLGYGNKEMQKLSDLFAVSKKRESNVEMNGEPFCNGATFHSSQSKKVPSTKDYHQQQNSSWNYESCSGVPSFAKIPQPPLSFQFPGVFSYPEWSGINSGMSLPRIPPVPPPPPPPLLSNDVIDEDNEALCSMLMSWYMSGYHTGYYQGFKQGQKQNVCCQNHPKR